jgi:hypothetical protein
MNSQTRLVPQHTLLARLFSVEEETGVDDSQDNTEEEGDHHLGLKVRSFMIIISTHLLGIFVEVEVELLLFSLVALDALTCVDHIFIMVPNLLLAILKIWVMLMRDIFLNLLKKEQISPVMMMNTTVIEVAVVEAIAVVEVVTLEAAVAIAPDLGEDVGLAVELKAGHAHEGTQGQGHAAEVGVEIDRAVEAELDPAVAVENIDPTAEIEMQEAEVVINQGAKAKIVHILVRIKSIISQQAKKDRKLEIKGVDREAKKKSSQNHNQSHLKMKRNVINHGAKKGLLVKDQVQLKKAVVGHIA